MKLLFFTDPHLGVDRKANTTSASRQMLKNLVAEAVYQVLIMQADARICVGDFFDTYSNNEEEVIRAIRLFDNVDWCLAGNHDVINDSTKRGSLDLIREVYGEDRVCRAEVGESVFHVKHFPGRVNVYAVPHHTGQEAFEQALMAAMDAVDVEEVPSNCNILLLHCNYNLPEAVGNDTALNITEEDADLLLKTFDYVLLGHDHTPAEYFDGRLKVIGNLFPTSFSDISNKRVLIFDTITKEFESIAVWDKDYHYREVLAGELLYTEKFVQWEPVQFIDVVGKVHPGDVAQLTRAITEKLWKPLAGSVLAVRNSTGIFRDEKAVNKGTDQADTLTLPERIDKALTGTDMYDLWSELYAAQKEIWKC